MNDALHSRASSHSRVLRRVAAAVALLLPLLLATPLGARDGGGHPGPDVFLFYELRIERGRLFLLHETRWTDLACREVETRQGDADHDGVTSEAEAKAFAEAWAETVRNSFRVEVQGGPVDLDEPEVRVDRHTPSPEDQARREEMEARGYENVTDLAEFEGISDEFRVYLDFEILLPDVESITIALIESAHLELEAMGFPLVKITNAFVAYGDEESGITFLDWTPPDDPTVLVDMIELEFDWTGRGPSLVEWTEWVNPDEGLKDLLEDIIKGRIGIWLGMMLALIYGMAHAFAPGHGKALVGAYLVGTSGRMRDAVWLGLIVAAAHTISVLAVALAVGIFYQTVDEDLLIRWIGIGSALGILVLGIWLVWRNLRAVIARQPVYGHHHHHGHSHDHHDHDHHHHDHRLPAKFSELLALGIVGGAMPCPTAIFILLWSLQNDYPWTALLVVGTFSVGLAGVLVVIGLVMVSSVKGIEKLSGSRQRLGLILLVLPLLSSLAILGVGVFLTYLAMGW